MTLYHATAVNAAMAMFVPVEESINSPVSPLFGICAVSVMLAVLLRFFQWCLVTAALG